MTTATVAHRSERWRRLTRRDLMNFDDVSTDAVLTAMDRGGVGRISSKGHAILRAPGGATMSVSPNSNKSKQVTAIRVRKLFPETNDKPQAAPQPPPAPNNTNQAEATMPKPDKSIACTNPTCDETFATEGALYAHVNSKHVVCPAPGCLYSRDSNRGVVPHHRIVHLGLAPRRLAKGSGKTTDSRGRALAATPAIVEQKKAPAAEAAEVDGRREGGFRSMTKERRRELARAGAEKRWAKFRAEKAEKERARLEAELAEVGDLQDAAEAQAAADAPTQPAQAPTAEPVGDHTRERSQAPTEVPVVDVSNLLAQAGRVDELMVAQTEVIRRVDDWITGERLKYESWLAEATKERDDARAERDDLAAKLALLREALDA